MGWPSDDDHLKVAAQVSEAANGALGEATCELLANTYGMRGIDLARSVVANPELARPLVPGRPEILAQVDWAVHRELASTVEDVLHRRTQLFFRDEDQGLGASEAVADRLAQLLGWTSEERAASLADYAEDVARSRRWQEA